MADPQQNKPVLLVGGHPIAHALWEPLTQDYNLVFLYQQASDMASSMGMKIPALVNFLTPQATEWALNEEARLVAQMSGSMAEVSRRFGVALEEDANLTGASDELARFWPGYCVSHIHGLAQRVSALRAVSEQFEIAGCVTHEDVAPDTRSMVNWCNARAIPTVHVPHANCHLTNDGGPDIHRETRATWIAASGVYAAQWYAQGGHPADRIRLTGMPQWDALYDEHSIPGRQEARRVLGLPDDGLVLCYAMTWTQTTGLRGGWASELEAGWNAVIEATKALGADLIVKLHPNDGATSEDAVAKAMNDSGVRGMVTRHHNSYVIRAADCLIAQGPSNMCTEAAILGTPSAYIQSEGFDYAYPLPYRCPPGSLTDTVREAISSRADPRWQEMCKVYNDAHPGGGSIRRVVEMVKEICQP